LTPPRGCMWGKLPWSQYSYSFSLAIFFFSLLLCCRVLYANAMKESWNRGWRGLGSHLVVWASIMWRLAYTSGTAVPPAIGTLLCFPVLHSSSVTSLGYIYLGVGGVLLCVYSSTAVTFCRNIGPPY
jgi:hypothetical protein